MDVRDEINRLIARHRKGNWQCGPSCPCRQNEERVSALLTKTLGIPVNVR